MKPQTQTGVFLSVMLLLQITTFAGSIDEIVERKQLNVGVCEFAPWTFTNVIDKLEGFEVDVGNQVGFDMGVSVRLKVYPLEEIFGALDRGEVDLVAAGLAITPQRALKSDFSMPYSESGATIVTNRKLAPDVKKIEDLNQEGVVVAVIEGSFSAGLADQLFDVARIKTVPDGIAAATEILEGRAHAVLTSLPDARILVARHPDILNLPLSKPLVRSVAGFAVRRGNQSLLNYLNAWILSRTADNWLPSRYSYWFSGYEWVHHVKE